MPPTAHEAAARFRPRKDPACVCGSLASGGESLGEDLIDWGRGALGLTINEF